MVSRKWLVLTCGAGLVLIGSFLTAAYLASPLKQLAPALPALNVDPQQITLAGNSSGGFMAIQAGVAYSSTFRGVAAVAAGPYYCTEGNAAIGTRCVGVRTAGIPTQKLVDLARAWSEEGKIDPVANLASHKVYLFHGTLDSVIPREVVQAAADFYSQVAEPAQAAGRGGKKVAEKKISILANFDTPVVHGWASPYGPESCQNETANYVNKCRDVDVASEFLGHFYGPLQAKNQGQLGGQLIEFDQNEFFDDKNAEAHSAEEFGFAYIPAGCGKQAGCRAVLVLHGCQQDYGRVEKAFINQSGINQWADSNRIVVIYPQVKAVNLKNGHGCWDVVGYDGKDFAWKSGHQLRMLKRIADRIASKPTR